MAIHNTPEQRPGYKHDNDFSPKRAAHKITILSIRQFMVAGFVF